MLRLLGSLAELTPRFKAGSQTCVRLTPSALLPLVSAYNEVDTGTIYQAALEPFRSVFD